jgi:hypothetical protein
VTINDTNPPARRRFEIKRLFSFLFRPRAAFQWLAGEKSAAWLTPLLCLSLTLLLVTVASGFLRARLAAMGEVNLPTDWQWWSDAMRNNYMQAMQATQSPVFLYVIPAITSLAGLWLGWGILSGLLHLASTLMGGRGSMSSALNIVAWASLPFALRDLLRLLFMFVARHPIASPGLSGFVTASGNGALFLANLLKNVDLFFIWQVILLIMGFSLVDSLPRGKAAASVLVVLLASLLVQAGISTLLSKLGGMMVTRPFM